jgi:hypothetical protein
VSAEYIERLRSRDLLSAEHSHAFAPRRPLLEALLAETLAPDNERELEAAE